MSAFHITCAQDNCGAASTAAVSSPAHGGIGPTFGCIDPGLGGAELILSSLGLPQCPGGRYPLNTEEVSHGR